MKKLGLTFLLPLTFGLGACSTAETIEVVRDTSVEVGMFVGVIDEPQTMKKPDYYSTKQIAKEYEFGQLYDLNHLNCDKAARNCR